MTERLPPLPESVLVVAEVIGRRAALHLAGALPAKPSEPWKGHTYVPTPARLEPDHVLVAILGWHDAVRLARAFGGEILQMSNCRGLERALRNRRIWELRADGLNAREIGDLLELNPETVKKVLQLGPAAGNPGMARAG